MVAEHGCSILIHGSMTNANETKVDAEVSITTCHQWIGKITAEQFTLDGEFSEYQTEPRGAR